MGRAGRPNGENKIGFDPLRELEEEGLPEGWTGYWQGERGEIQESVSGWKDEEITRLESHPLQRDIDRLQGGSEDEIEEGLKDIWERALEGYRNRYGSDSPTLEYSRASWQAHVWRSLEQGDYPLLPATHAVIPSVRISALEEINVWNRRSPQDFDRFFEKEILPGIRGKAPSVTEWDISIDSSYLWSSLISEKLPQLLPALDAVTNSGWTSKKSTYIFGWSAFAALREGKSFEEAGGEAARNAISDTMHSMVMMQRLHQELQNKHPRIAEMIPSNLLQADQNDQLWAEVMKPMLDENPHDWQLFARGEKTFEDMFDDFIRRKYGQSG